MIFTVPLYSLRDVSIIPAVVTSILSRQECCPLRTNLEKTQQNFLPLVVAPMSCVLDETNFQEFHQSRINCVVPRSVSLNKRLTLAKTVMTAFSRNEANDLLQTDPSVRLHVCLDMANGHMQNQIDIGRALKKHFADNIILMGGNIANPQTYLLYNDAGFDYVRVGIGGGNACLTSTNTGVHYPMASLLSEIADIRKAFGYQKQSTAIVADGGIGSYAEAIKCLALGADLVMMGRVFTKAALSNQKIGDEVPYYGMSTKIAQKEMGNAVLKTSEGRSICIFKEYTLTGWAENFTDYLRSAMSYCDCKTLEDFKNAHCHVISPNSAVMINDK